MRRSRTPLPSPTPKPNGPSDGERWSWAQHNQRVLKEPPNETQTLSREQMGGDEEKEQAPGAFVGWEPRRPSLPCPRPTPGAPLEVGVTARAPMGPLRSGDPLSRRTCITRGRNQTKGVKCPLRPELLGPIGGVGDARVCDV